MGTYAELVTDIQNITENTFDASGSTNIDRIIRDAEQRIYNAVTLPATRTTASLTATIGNPDVALPADFLAPLSLAVIVSSTYTYLLNKDEDFIREAYPVVATTGVPVHYAMADAETLKLGPTPGVAYSLVLEYFAYPESIVTADTTWLGDNFYFVLLSACLLEAAIFMKSEEDTLTAYDEQFKRAIAALKNYGNGKTQQDDYRSGSPRTKVV